MIDFGLKKPLFFFILLISVFVLVNKVQAGTLSKEEFAKSIALGDKEWAESIAPLKLEGKSLGVVVNKLKLLEYKCSFFEQDKLPAEVQDKNYWVDFITISCIKPRSEKYCQLMQVGLGVHLSEKHNKTANIDDLDNQKVEYIGRSTCFFESMNLIETP